MAAQIKPCKPRKHTKLNPAKVEELREKGLTCADIAKHQGVDQSTVYRYLVDYTGRKERLESAKNNMAGLLMQSIADNMELAHLIRADIKENWGTYKNQADLRLKKEWLVALEGGRHYNYLDYRLETDQSTDNQAVLVQAITDWRTRKKSRNRELSGLSTGEMEIVDEAEGKA